MLPPPTMAQFVKALNKKTETTAQAFFQVGQLSGSLTSFDGCGIRTKSLFGLFLRFNRPAALKINKKRRRNDTVNQRYRAFSCVEFVQGSKSDHVAVKVSMPEKEQDFSLRLGHLKPPIFDYQRSIIVWSSTYLGCVCFGPKCILIGRDKWPFCQLRKIPA
jgi:hypothetical protein